MHIEGRLQIDLYLDRGQVNQVSIQSSRPLQAVRIFEGKTPHEVLMQLPLLFRVCGVAQATAAIKAFRSAQVQAKPDAGDAGRALLIQMETAREHLWRILIDWPELAGEATEARRAAPLQPMLSAFRQALFADGDALSLQAQLRVDDSALYEQIGRLDEMLARLVFGCTPAQWLGIGDVDELDDWINREKTVAARLLRQVSRDGWQGLGAVNSKFLPDLPDTELNRHLGERDADRFIATPTWKDRTCETTSLVRQYDRGLIGSLQGEFGNGLLTRLVARLVELAGIPATMRALVERLDDAFPEPVRGNGLPPSVGIGQVEAARGRLVHRVEMDGVQVCRYQILAPTEWNFHPAGVVARGLESLQGKGECILRRQAAMLINAVDPCVGYDLQVH